MRNLVFNLIGILVFSVMSITSFCQDPISINPNNANASVSLSWLNDIARLRIGGEGVGATNGFEIQGTSDNVLMKFLNNGNVGIGTSNPVNKLQVQGGSISIGPDGGTVMPNLSREAAQGGLLISRVGALDGSLNKNLMIIKGAGNVGIGTTNPGYKLDVVGTIRAQEIKVDMNGADFVFDDNYNLKSLEEVESFVKENKHLPEIEPATKMEASGVELGEFNSKLLQKIEELTLYMINMNERMNSLETENNDLKEEITKLKSVR